MQPIGRSILQKSRTIGKPEIIISFHSSGSTSNQWRKPKNSWFPGITPFRPSCSDGELMDGGDKQGARLAHSAGPTCLLYLTRAPGNRWFLPDRDSSRNIIPSYGQYQSTLVYHMDVEKAAYSVEEENESELETSLFHFHLPSSYVSCVPGSSL
uniref:Ribosomal protein L10 n=1 Tax=Sciadopitys verticillata TaxID=28979 RepID=A0A8H2SER3_SCIVE|nr:ribosomal protein L10 [Sciadopitys verticillata]